MWTSDSDAGNAVARRVRTDALRLRQVLMNLVGNAIKFTQVGGVQMTVSCERRDGGSRLRFQVADNGPGIDEQQRARIFDKFERVVTTSAYQSGFGLGLWIVGRMVAAHHGRVDAQPGPLGGTVFSVTLPVDAEQPTRKESP